MLASLCSSAIFENQTIVMPRQFKQWYSLCLSLVDEALKLNESCMYLLPKLQYTGLYNMYIMATCCVENLRARLCNVQGECWVYRYIL